MTRFWKNRRHWKSVHLTETSRLQGVGPREIVVVAKITRYMLWGLVNAHCHGKISQPNPWVAYCAGV